MKILDSIKNALSGVSGGFLKEAGEIIKDYVPDPEKRVELKERLAELELRRDKAEAEAINSLVSALVALNDAEVISKQTMVEELRPYLRKLIAYDFNGDADEKSRILAEAAERAAAVQETLRAESEQLENDDRDAGIRAGGGAGALTDN